MEDSAHSPPLPILIGRSFMKITQTKIDVAKGALTMEFDGDVIKFNVYESVKNSNDVCSCYAIDVNKNIGHERSAPSKKDVFRTTIEEGIELDLKGHATTLKIPNQAERTTSEIIDSAATFESSSQYIGKPPIPIPIPISTNRLLPSLVQVPNRIQAGGRVYIDFRKLNATIRKDHYPLLFIDPMHGSFKEHVVEDVPFHVVGPNGA
ncbi:hypothetical protein ACFX2G_041484 [Malus domestica]